MSANSLGLCVLGLGNPLMGDDGIGVVVARRLRELEIKGARVFEAGTPGYGLFDVFAEEKRVVFIDAVDSGSSPGSVDWVDPQAVIEDKARQSLHQVGLADVLSLLDMAQNKPWVRVIGIQPQQINVGVEISEELNGKLVDITETTLAMIKSIV